MIVHAQSSPSFPIPTPWTVSCQASLSMGFPRQEYWSGLPFPSPDPGIKLVSTLSSAVQADSVPTEALGKLVSGRSNLVLLSELCFGS